MKNYFLLTLLITSLCTYAQSECDDASAYLVNAYSHVKKSYESNNISHLKHYANRSLESFKLSKTLLESCNCKKALELTNKGIDLLAKVENEETYEDGRFHVKRAKEISKESMIEIDKCAYANVTDETTEEENVIADTTNDVIRLIEL